MELIKHILSKYGHEITVIFGFESSRKINQCISFLKGFRILIDVVFDLALVAHQGLRKDRSTRAQLRLVSRKHAQL